MPRRLWQALERIPGLAEVEGAWMALAGAEYPHLRPMLRPNGQRARSYPCLKTGGCGCAHDVVEHGPDDITAVCRCGSECESIRLVSRDLAVHELNRAALARAVAAAVRLESDDVPVDGLHETRRIGFHAPLAGFRYPIFLTIQADRDDLLHVVERLVAVVQSSFAILTPTRDLWAPACDELLRRRQALHLTLADVFDGQDRDARARSTELFATWTRQVMPATDGNGGMVFFPTPAGAAWHDVDIRFKDGHAVSVRVGDAAGVYLYSQMGMADRRSSRPTKQWELLREFAECSGTFTWSSKGAGRHNQKRREKLAGDLQRFFRIEGDPFTLTADGKGWQARFSISPES